MARRRRRSNSGMQFLGWAALAACGLKLALSSAVAPWLLGTAGFLLLCSLLSAIAISTPTPQPRIRELQQLDSLDGHAFEQAVAALMNRLGYSTTVTPGSGDMGVDVIACRGKRRIAVQVKRYAKPVGRSAVADAVAGMAPHRCSEAMVVTNSRFSPSAVELARLHHCTLIDRDGLAAWLRQAG